MKLRSAMMLALTALTFACAPQIKDPMAGLGTGAASARLNSGLDDKALSVGLILSENTKNTAAYIGRSDIAKYGYIDIDKKIQDFIAVFRSHFKSVVILQTIGEAPDAHVDLVVVLDVYAYLRSTIFQTQEVAVKAILLSPDRAPIDSIAVEGERRGTEGSGLGAERIGTALSFAADDARNLLEAGLFSSRKLQDFARSAAAEKPKSAAPRAERVAAAAAPLHRENAPSDVDKPDYSAPEDPNKFAVVIGVEKYASLPAAEYADHDAAAVLNHLIALGFAPRHIKVLRGQNATRAKMAAYIEDWLPKNVTPKSTVFFYYSGHGSPDSKTSQGYLVPSDGDPEYLDRTGYSLNELYKRLGALPAKRVLVALDSCFSGAGGRSVLAKGARPLVTQINLDPMSGDKIVTLAAAKGDQISGTMNEQSHGVFTYYMLKGLNGAALKNGEVTLQSLYQYLKPKVEDAASLDNRDQVPQLFPAAGAGLVLRAR